MGPDEVCGSPLVTNVFDEKEEYCRMSKRKCAKHFCWEKLRRAEIDLERLRQVCVQWATDMLELTVDERQFFLSSTAEMLEIR